MFQEDILRCNLKFQQEQRKESFGERLLFWCKVTLKFAEGQIKNENMTTVDMGLENRWKEYSKKKKTGKMFDFSTILVKVFLG